MIRNYLKKIALRRLWREKGYAAINVTGLALGMASCLLIGLFVRDELSYDDFHEDVDRIVFVGKKLIFGERSDESNSTSYPLAETLEREVPSVDSAVQTFWPSPAEVSHDGKTFIEEEDVFYIGANFFEIFNFPIIAGELDGGLAEPNTAVISREMAEKHFPNENPVGTSLIVKERGEHTYQIVGVAEQPGDSYLDFNAVLSLSTLNYANTHGEPAQFRPQSQILRRVCGMREKSGTSGKGVKSGTSSSRWKVEHVDVDLRLQEVFKDAYVAVTLSRARYKFYSFHSRTTTYSTNRGSIGTGTGVPISRWSMSG